MELLGFSCVCIYHNCNPSENLVNTLCFPPDLFEGLAGICGGGVLGIVSPALPDDQDSSTNRSVNG